MSMATPNRNQPGGKPPIEDFSLKKTSPNITGGRPSNVPVSPLDLVEKMLFLYVKVEKARNLPETCNPYVELKLGNYRANTKHFDHIPNPEWKQVFAFSQERIQATSLDVSVLNHGSPEPQAMLGQIILNISDFPNRVLPDGQLATQWYRLEDKNGVKVPGELMLAAWMGTQGDEAYSIAWHSDAASISGVKIGVVNTRSIIYSSPKLWYLRVNVIEAQDLIILDKSNNRKPEVLVEAQLGRLVFPSKVSESKSENPKWNEDIMFVTEDPHLANDLVLTLQVIDKVALNKAEVLGFCKILIKDIKKRIDPTAPGAKWHNLQRPEKLESEALKQEVKFASKLHIRVSLDGGYHVFEEPTHYSSDLRPSSKMLWTPSIGVLELGIISASGLSPMKQKENRTDAYCVAKYGSKWARTRTIVDNFAPKWNEQYTWEVYDPCTVLTIGVFDNGYLQDGQDHGFDTRIGKIRIRLSTLETGRVYTHSYPLVALLPSGVKKMGEIQLVVRFSCLSMINMLHTYTQPLLPKMHYLLPLSVYQLDHLRHQSTMIISERLEKAEPKLRREVVHYMLDADSHIWSLRKSRANFDRVATLFEGLIAIGKWIDKIRNWSSPVTSILAHVLLLFVVFFPELILPTLCFYLVVMGLWGFKSRPRNPPHMDTKLSHAYTVGKDELEEEFDSFPSKAPNEALRRRYDRLRHIGGKMQVVIGDMATQGERFQSLMNWRDPRATCLFILSCLVAGVLFYIISFQLLLVSLCFYGLRHPKLRLNLPSVPQNFLRRMPARTDCLL